MSKEYIERDCLIDMIAERNRNTCNGKMSCIQMKRMVESIPNADVAPVVRCKECKHWKPSGSKAGNSFSDMEYIGGCEFANYCRRESDFCSYGERKEGAD